MSSIPKVDKSKYNHNKPFAWIDSQCEKFMTEQKELKSHIKQLQDDLVTCNEHFQKQRKNMEDLVSRVPSHYLTKKIAVDTASVDSYEEQTHYIYERNPDTQQLYRRELGDYNNKIPVDDDKNPYAEQLSLFQPNDVY